MPEGPMIDPENSRPSWATVSLVQRLIDDIDHSTGRERDALLSEMLCAAWPTRRGQSQ